MKVTCPICSKQVNFESGKPLPRYFPFCSQRCKLVDLGKWLNEEYKIIDPLPGNGTLTEEEKRQISMDMIEEGEADDIIEDEDDRKGNVAKTPKDDK